MVNELLSEGKESAIPARDLINALDVSSRDFFAIVQRERRSGFPICASKSQPYGYYLAKDKSEINAYTKEIELTARDMRQTARLMKKSAETLPEGEKTNDSNRKSRKENQ